MNKKILIFSLTFKALRIKDKEFIDILSDFIEKNHDAISEWLVKQNWQSKAIKAISS